MLYVVFAHSLPVALCSIDKAFRISQINDVVAYAVAILGLNLVIGYSGQLSLGQSAFVGLGAYTTIILVADHNWSYFATIPVSAGLCFVVGLIVGLPALRISGLYLAIVTLAVAYVFPTLVLKFESPHGRPERQEARSRRGRAGPTVVDAVRRRRPHRRAAVGLLHPHRDGHGPVPAGPQLHQEPARPRPHRRA